MENSIEVHPKGKNRTTKLSSNSNSGNLSRKWKHKSLNDICTPMFIAAFLIIQMIWKQPKCISMDEWIKNMWCVLCLVTQFCPTLCDQMGCSQPGSSVHGDSSGKNTGVGCYGLLEGIFSTWGSNPCLPRCRQILYHLSHQGTPKILEWVTYPFFRRAYDPGIKPGLLHCRWILYQLSYQGSPKNMWYIYTMEYYSATKKWNLAFCDDITDLHGIMLK